MKQNKESKQLEQDRLKDFFDEVKSIKPSPSIKKESVNDTETQKSDKNSGLYYQCPACHKLVTSRKETCKHCGYTGYIPMSEVETKRIRRVLFVIILIGAAAVYILTR
jgi:uncharacterized OB-fold protein